ncbi:hypothetical protein CCAX7_21800 [Capsulimonas corticalis]|uniref:Uncharacterized protein n=1 Tax=Capsulimonas corticalis TaxID=2219043 RepID=A0A402D210_9BACT|nr:hypothetical protein [Capsulimonas corticalis]BDI30129.1 hypothetical protein CCAX7_21800 [Capsulimonas corticalis]
MNTKTKLFMMAALTLASCTLPTVAAHAGRLGGRRHAQSGDRMQAAMDKLNLSDDQKAKIKPITDKTKQQLKSVKSDSSLTTDEKKAKAREIVMDSFQQIKPILTPQQQEQLMQMVQQAMQKMQQSGKGKGGA